MKKVLFKKFGIALVFALVLSLMSSAVAYASIPDGWNENHTKYYVDGVAVSGFKTIDNQRYYFSPDDNVKVIGLNKIGSDYYFFNDSGVMGYGWKINEGSKYYFNTKTGKGTKGVVKIGDSYYYFGSNAAQKKNWQIINGQKYRFDPKSGKANVGLKKLGKYYYGFAKNGKMLKGWQTIKGQRFYFNTKHGAGYIGLKKIGSGYYDFSSGARMQTGWKTINGYKYYFSPKKGSSYGKAVTGTQKIGGTTYKFNKKGQLITPEMKMLTRAQKYKSDTNYLILVNKSTHRVGIFKRSKGIWKMNKYWLCTIGAPGTPTPSGTFRMGHGSTAFHQRYFDSGAIRCWYASNFYGGYHFHSVLYVPASGPYRVAYGQLGANLSHGCIRLKLENAKWIYNHIPRDTKVVIYS